MLCLSLSGLKDLRDLAREASSHALPVYTGQPTRCETCLSRTAAMWNPDKITFSFASDILVLECFASPRRDLRNSPSLWIILQRRILLLTWVQNLTLTLGHKTILRDIEVWTHNSYVLCCQRFAHTHSQPPTHTPTNCKELVLSVDLLVLLLFCVPEILYLKLEYNCHLWPSQPAGERIAAFIQWPSFHPILFSPLNLVLVTQGFYTS